MPPSKIIAILLLVIAAYCAFNWAFGALLMWRVHRKRPFDLDTITTINKGMFYVGLCGICALGFAGALL